LNSPKPQSSNSLKPQLASAVSVPPPPAPALKKSVQHSIASIKNRPLTPFYLPMATKKRPLSKGQGKQSIYPFISLQF
jgi:hypothetical protein